MCPHCAVPLVPADRYCPNCEIGLDWTPGTPRARLPEIRPGAVLLSTSFAAAPLPGYRTRDEDNRGGRSLRGTRDGIVATYEQANTSAFSDLSRSLTDACVRATFTALDAGARLGLQARHVAVGGAQTYYSLDASVDKGAAWLSRAVQRRGFAAAETIAAPVASPAITAGRPVELELRVQGPTLSAWAGGAELFRVHDPTFGCGAFGIRAGRERRATRPVRVLCVGYEIREVAR